VSYHFDPARTRAAAAAITTRFASGARTPLGLEALFEQLAQMKLSKAADWGATLTPSEIDLLCSHFNQAPASRAISAIAVILAARNDPRCGDVARGFFHRLPPRGELTEFAAAWQSHDMAELAGPGLTWIDDYLRQGASQPIPGYVGGRFRAGALTLEQLEGSRAERTPLMNAFADLVFSEGGALMALLPPGRAADFAEAYLKAGDDAKVLAYLTHYPEEHWQLNFLRRLYLAKGPPDPAAGAFYRDTPPGRLWALRRALFEPETADGLLTVERQDFWRRWLHRVSDWRWDEGKKLARVVIRPLIVIEEPECSSVYLMENPKRSIIVIVVDHRWADKLEETLREFISWGFDG